MSNFLAALCIYKLQFSHELSFIEQPFSTFIPQVKEKSDDEGSREVIELFQACSNIQAT